MWVDTNELLHDEQNGFRQGRNCIDHIFSLVNIIESRIKCKQNTFAAFIDFKKAYDHVNPQQLWNKLSSLGLAPGTNIFKAL